MDDNFTEDIEMLDSLKSKNTKYNHEIIFNNEIIVQHDSNEIHKLLSTIRDNIQFKQYRRDSCIGTTNTKMETLYKESISNYHGQCDKYKFYLEGDNLYKQSTQPGKINKIIKNSLNKFPFKTTKTEYDITDNHIPFHIIVFQSNINNSYVSILIGNNIITQGEHSKLGIKQTKKSWDKRKCVVQFPENIQAIKMENIIGIDSNKKKSTLKPNFRIFLSAIINESDDNNVKELKKADNTIKKKEESDNSPNAAENSYSKGIDSIEDPVGINLEYDNGINVQDRDISNNTPDIYISTSESTKVSSPLRQEVWNEFFGNSEIGKCIVCGSIIYFNENTPTGQRKPYNSYQVMHTNARIFGGEDKIENLNPGCKSCNCSMGTEKPVEYVGNRWGADRKNKLIEKLQEKNKFI